MKKLHRTLRKWRTNNEGVTAIEFAMVAPIFFALLLMTIESGIVFTAQQLIDASLNTATRPVLTGATQPILSATNTGGAGFRDAVCAGMSSLVSTSDCKAGMKIDMKVFTASTVLSSSILGLPSDPPDQASMKCSNFGGAGSYMLIRAYYQYPVYVSFLNFTGSSAGHSLLVGSSTMKLEPSGATPYMSPNPSCT